LFGFPVRLAYQPPASSTILSEQTIHQQSANNTFFFQKLTWCPAYGQSTS
jgi:hypothetical protein